MPSVPPEPAASTAEPKSRLSLGILALIVAVAVFSGVVAFLVFDRFGDELMKKWVTAGEPAAVAAPAPKQAPAPAGTPEDEGAAADEAQVPATEAATDEAVDPVEAEAADATETAETEGVEETEGAAQTGAAAEPLDAKVAVVPPPDPSDNAPKIAPVAKAKPRSTRRSRPKPVVAPEPESDISASDQKMLDEFGSGANAAPAKIDVQKSGSTQSKKPALDGDGVRATVTTNKPRLQRCYERAIRGQQSPPSVRLDITVMVAPSGRVKNVTSEGSGPGGLAECVEASVRRWRFPDSSDGGPARFPIVFSAN
ncbi:MAG: AgmX/PglI C-terminal domain-containing protein [Myxococcota bacterium]